MIRVRVISALGSTPRDAGAEMFVGPDKVQGTIGAIRSCHPSSVTSAAAAAS